MLSLPGHVYGYADARWCIPPHCPGCPRCSRARNVRTYTLRACVVGVRVLPGLYPGVRKRGVRSLRVCVTSCACVRGPGGKRDQTRQQEDRGRQWVAMRRMGIEAREA